MNLPLQLHADYLPQFLAALEHDTRRPADATAASSWEDMVRERADARCGMVRIAGTAIAVQPVTGYMAAGCDDEDEAFFGCYNTLRLMDAADAVAADAAIKCLVLHISSPGGSAMMVQQAAQALVDLKTRRPDVTTLAFIDGLGCSAAMWIAAACDEIHAAAGSMVGSISTILINVDSSEAYQRAGLRVTAITDGEYKSLGQPGVPVTPKQLTFLEDFVKSMGAEFKGFMATRREGLTDADMQGQPFLAVEGRYPAPLLDSAVWSSPRQFLTAVAQELSATPANA